MVTFLIADSGMGKSTACYQIIRKHMEEGDIGLWVNPEAIEGAVSLSQIIDRTLKAYHPKLEMDSTASLTRIMEDSQQLLLVVDDINRSKRPIELVERLTAWNQLSSDIGDESFKRRTRLICPVWPQIIGLVSEQSRNAIDALSLVGGPLTRDEARRAVRQRAENCGLKLTDLESLDLADALACDPLLIRLCFEDEKQIATKSLNPIGDYIRRSLTRLAEAGGSNYIRQDHEAALSQLARQMLAKRNWTPEWNTIKQWFEDDVCSLSIFSILLKYREICHIDSWNRLVFRHDRLREYILVDAAKTFLDCGSVDSDILGDPYYAEIFGKALLGSNESARWIDRIRNCNPLALFEAFRQLRNTHERSKAIFNGLHNWLSDLTTQNAANAHLCWEAHVILSRTDSSRVLDLAPLFHRSSWHLLEARMRNGDVKAGAAYLFQRGIGAHDHRRDTLIRHMIEKFGLVLLENLSRLLKTDEKQEIVQGGLYLAGFISNSALAPAISQCWQRYNDINPDFLAAFIWAGTRCGGSALENLLDPMFDRWTTLSGEPHDNHRLSDRDYVSYDELEFAFARGCSDETICYLIQKAEEKNLTSPIANILCKVDHPDAIAWHLRYIADLITKHSRSNAAVFMQILHLRRTWSDRADKPRGMSEASRAMLYELWGNSSNNSDLRQIALELWAQTGSRGDASILQLASQDCALGDKALYYRIFLSDRTAVPLLINKLQSDAYFDYWTQYVHRVWCHEVEHFYNERFGQIDQESYGDSQSTSGTTFIRCAATTLMQVPNARAEPLLSKHWNNLKCFDCMIIAALFVGNQSLRKRAAGAIAEHSNPKSIFQRFSINYGIKQAGRDEKIAQASIESLTPYLKHLRPMCLHQLWTLCNERGWFDWHRNHLDECIVDKETDYASFGLDEKGLFADLDKFAEHGKPQPYFWLEEFQERNDPPGRALAITRSWLARHRNIAAVTVAAEIVKQVGTRSDLDLLDIVDSSCDPVQIQSIKENTRYAVFRRSLL